MWNVIVGNQIDRTLASQANVGRATFQMGDINWLACCGSKLETDSDAQAGLTVGMNTGVHVIIADATNS